MGEDGRKMGEKSEYALHRETHVVSTWEKVLSLIKWSEYKGKQQHGLPLPTHQDGNN